MLRVLEDDCIVLENRYLFLIEINLEEIIWELSHTHFRFTFLSVSCSLQLEFTEQYSSLPFYLYHDTYFQGATHDVTPFCFL